MHFANPTPRCSDRRRSQLAPLVLCVLLTLVADPSAAAVHVFSDRCKVKPAPMPETPALSFTTTVSAGLSSAVVALSGARFVAVADSTRLIQWDSSGRERWGALLPTAATSSPFALADRIFLTTRQGVLLSYSHRGMARESLPLPLSEPKEPTRLLALDCLTLAIVSGSDLVIVSDNAVRAHVNARGRIVSASAQPNAEGVRFVTESGDYYHWLGHLEPVLVRPLLTADVMLNTQGGLIAEGNTLTQYRVRTDDFVVVGALPVAPLEGPPFSSDEAWWTWTSQGQLFAIPRRRKTPALLWPGLSGAQRQPPVVVDPSGRAATLAPDGRLVTWQWESGHSFRSARRYCSDAVGLLVLTDGTLVVACQSGRIYGFDDGA